MTRSVPSRGIFVALAAAWTLSGLWCVCDIGGADSHSGAAESHGHSHGQSESPAGEYPQENGHGCECESVLAAVEMAWAVRSFASESPQRFEAVVEAELALDPAAETKYWIGCASESPPGTYGLGTVYLDHAVLLL